MQQAKIKPFTGKTSQPSQTPVKSQPDKRRHRVHQRRVVVLGTLLLAICGGGAVALSSSHQALSESTAQVTHAKRDLATHKATTAALKVQVDQLKNEDYLAKLVRQKYLVSKQGEVVFTLPGLTNGGMVTTGH
ncbi:FtsB family cell division protein [Lacticaseibacillus mingshuiensis]|uniref:Septum formation initiator family protein n=1 Tax=Lacticaseibacillus mingshuiensis TaxID=2799574 RepID=A0ABW4CLZ6_9LACO|nr:septum formation initiator family protein [Lacticaseibacillus mingshuiensis]